MAAKSERPKNRRIHLVGGGYKWTRDRAEESGGSLKSQRRKLHQALRKDRKGPRKLTVVQRKSIKERISELLHRKDSDA